MSGIPLVFPEAHPCLERAPRALCVYLIVGCCWIRGDWATRRFCWMNLFFFPLVSKRLYCVLMSCCGYPSRNPSSLLDPWPLPPPRPARPPSAAPLLSSGTSALCRRRQSRARLGGHTDGASRSHDATRRFTRLCFWILRTTPAGGLARLSLALGMWTTALG